uniref:protein SAAL1 isoform X1 n=1 Tax=Myxine glutinosa TaxID=7769 RepID=UPI00358EFB0D
MKHCSPFKLRNPSPPPNESSDDEEKEEKANNEKSDRKVGGPDAIGDTIYSKSWLLSVLSRVVEQAQVNSTNKEVVKTDLVLDKELEDDMCKIWDMSMDEVVAAFLQKVNGISVLHGVIERSLSWRLIEICVGILGNMTCFLPCCLALNNDEAFIDFLLQLLGESDPPTLLETSRLILTCLSHNEASSSWLAKMKTLDSVFDNVCFILKSSTNADLLLKVGKVLDSAFDQDEELMVKWATKNSQDEKSINNPPSTLTLALFEAILQLRTESPEALEVYLHVLQLLTTTDEGSSALVRPSSKEYQVWHLLLDILTDLCHPADPVAALLEQRVSLACILSVLSTMLSSPGGHLNNVANSHKLLRDILTVFQYLASVKSSGKPNVDWGALPLTRERCKRSTWSTERDGSGNGRRGGKRESEIRDLQLFGDDPHVAIIRESAKDILATVCLHCSATMLRDAITRKTISTAQLKNAVLELFPSHSESVHHLLSELRKACPAEAELLLLESHGLAHEDSQ